MTTAQNEKLAQLFKKYLTNKKLSKVTVKNYISDLHHFFEWSAKNDLKNTSRQTFSLYKKHLLVTHTPSKTINRYLSTLRSYGEFLQAKGITLINPAEELKNPATNTEKQPEKTQALLNNFKKSLKQEDLSKTTIKNYLSDVNQFVGFINKK
jgi:site-specific recombinase XerD